MSFPGGKRSGTGLNCKSVSNKGEIVTQAQIDGHEPPLKISRGRIRSRFSGSSYFQFFLIHLIKGCEAFFGR